MTAHDRTAGPSRTRRKHLGSLLRISLATTALGALLTACSMPSPSGDWRAQAAAARSATAALTAYDFDAHASFTVIADRFIDRCGEITFAQDGRRDDNPSGHACTAVRTVVLKDHAAATTQRNPEERLLGLLKTIGLDGPPSVTATTGIDHQTEPVDGVRYHVRGFTGTIAGTEPIEMFDSSSPWLHDPDTISESTTWNQAILDDPGAFPRQTIIIAVSATYFDSTRS